MWRKPQKGKNDFWEFFENFWEKFENCWETFEKNEKFEKILETVKIWENREFLKNPILLKMENGPREIRTTRAKLGIFGRNATLICEDLDPGMKSNWGFQATLLNTIPNPPPSIGSLGVFDSKSSNTTSNFPLHSSNSPSPPLLSLNTANIQHQGVAPSPLCSPFSICFPISVNHCLVLDVFLLVFSSFLSVLPPSINVYPPLPFACFFCSLSMCMICACSTFSKHFMSGGGGGLHMSIYTTSIIVSFLISLGRISLLAFSFSDSSLVFTGFCFCFCSCLCSIFRWFANVSVSFIFILSFSSGSALYPSQPHPLSLFFVNVFPPVPFPFFRIAGGSPSHICLHVLVPPFFFWFQAFHPPKQKWGGWNWGVISPPKFGGWKCHPPNLGGMGWQGHALGWMLEHTCDTQAMS